MRVGTFGRFDGYKVPLMDQSSIPMWQRLVSTCSLFLSLFLAPQLMAQQPVGLRVNALTSAERDAITANLRNSGELEVIYACVPAGLIVFGDHGRSASPELLRNKVLTAVAPLISAQRIAETGITLQAAQDACEIARGQ